MTVLQAPLTIRALDTNFLYGVAPVFKDTITGFRYNDSAGNTFTGTPSHVVKDNANNIVTGTIPAGAYKIVPGSLALNIPTNYFPVYTNGTLTVGKALLKAAARDTFRIYGAANPVFAINYSGFINGDNANSITPPQASTNATAQVYSGHLYHNAYRGIRCQLYSC